MAASEPEGGDRGARLRALHDRLDALDLAPYWATRGASDEHDEDGQVLKGRSAEPFLWRYADIEPLLRDAAELVTMDDSERRSIVLVNPGMAPARATVSTLYTAYRLNDPDEVMPPHRHTINAVRIGLTGASNFTAVEGEPIVFGPGDVVLTPAETWHNHGNRGDEHAVNVSVLDLPLSETLNAASFEHGYEEDGGGGPAARREQSARFRDGHSSRAYGHGGLKPRFVDHARGTGRHSPMYVYRWERTLSLLDSFRDHDGSPWDAISVEYTDPVSGGPVYPTMTFFGQLLRPGERTLPQRQNASQVCIPLHGRGRSVVGGRTFDWRPHDAIAIPGGHWYEHANGSDAEDAVLFAASDEPALRALGFQARHGRTADGAVVALG